MFDTGKIVTNKKELKNILENYYRKVTDDETITVHFETKFESSGPKNEDIPVVKITLKRVIKLGGYDAVIEERLDEKQINEALSSLLENEEYKIEKSYHNLDATYGNPRIGTSDKIIFSGLTVLLTKKGIKKILQEV